MIQLCTNLCVDALPQDWQGTYCSNRLQAYGLNAPFAPFYTDGQAVVSVLDGNAIVCGEMISSSEWAAFFKMQPDIQSVSLSFDAAVGLGEELHVPVTIKPIMRLEKPLDLPTIFLIQPSPRDMYPLLSEVFGETMPPFDNWYVDVSHKIRHDLCRTVGVEQDGNLVSTAMTVALTDKIAVIGAVATAQNYRRRGFAVQCICKLAADLLTNQPDMEILISPKNESAKRLYASLGFMTYDNIGCIEL